MLPNNDRTKVIMKAREEEQAAREATEKAVSATISSFKGLTTLLLSANTFVFICFIVKRQAAERREGAKKEGEC